MPGIDIVQVETGSMEDIMDKMEVELIVNDTGIKKKNYLNFFKK